MKRVVEVLFLYTAIIFGACIGISFLYGNLPVVLDIEEKSYTFFRGLSWFLVILPAVLISGFMIGCAVQWRSNADDSREKFSPAMLGRYKKVVLVGVVLTAVLTFSAEFFTPMVQNKLEVAEANPGLLSKYLNLGQEALLKISRCLLSVMQNRRMQFIQRRKKLLVCINRQKMQKIWHWQMQPRILKMF